MGIGKDISSNYHLDVSGNLNIRGNLTINGDAFTAGGWTTSGSDIVNSNDGNVIISGKLDAIIDTSRSISANTEIQMIKFKNISAQDNISFAISGFGYVDNEQTKILFTQNALTNFHSNMSFYTNGGSGSIERMRINNVGNVGIGVSTMFSKCKIQSTDSQTTLEVVNLGGGFAIGHAAMYNYVAASSSNIRCLTCNSAGFSNILDAYSSGSVCIRKVISGNKYPLEVGSSNLAPTANYTFLQYFNGLQFDKQAISPSISIFSEQGVMLGALYLYSDKRIKKNIVDLSDNECLNKLRLLKPCKYQYIDNIKKGISYVYGFIAQEVKEVINYSVDTNSQIIPDYYNLVEISNADVSFIEFDLSNNIQYDLSLNQTIRIIVEYSANIDDAEKLFKEYDTEVLNIQEKTIKIKNETNSQYIHKIFLYGKEVEDFHNLKKDAIWTVATSALQEVDRIQQRHQQEITQLTDEMNTLKSQYQTILSRLETIEQRYV